MDSSRRAILASIGGATTALAVCSFLASEEADPEPTDTLTPAPVTPTRSVPDDLAPVPGDVPETSLVTSAATGRTYAFTETERYVPGGGFVRAGFTSAPDSRMALVLTERHPFVEPAPSLRRTDDGVWVVAEELEAVTPGTV